MCYTENIQFTILFEVPAMIDVGKRIRERRKLLGLTGIDVSKAVGIGQSTLSQIENGTSPTLDTFLKICIALSIKPSELLGDESTYDLPSDLLLLIEKAKKLNSKERQALTQYLAIRLDE
jgi:transcriptional regulator with XRE-family HTH domain